MRHNLGYGVLRFLLEFARDTPIAYAGLTPSQCLLIPIVVTGLIVWGWRNPLLPLVEPLHLATKIRAQRQSSLANDGSNRNAIAIPKAGEPTSSD